MGAVESTAAEVAQATLPHNSAAGSPVILAQTSVDVVPLVSPQQLVDSKSKKANSRMHASCCLDMAAQMVSVSPLVRSLMELSFTPEVGYDTAGHTCLSTADLESAKHANSSLLYGEVLPAVCACKPCHFFRSYLIRLLVLQGVCKMLDNDHLRAERATRLFDLGAGAGKLCIQGMSPLPFARSCSSTSPLQPF
jgi:hypothetical protein